MEEYSRDNGPAPHTPNPNLVLFDQVEEHTIMKETPKTNKATIKKSS